MSDLNLGNIDDDEHVVLIEEAQYQNGVNMDLGITGKGVVRPVSSEEYNEVVGDETYKGRDVQEEEDHLVLRAPDTGGYDFAAATATEIDAEDALEESLNDFGSALQNAKESVDDTEVLDELNRYQGRVEGLAESYKSRLESVEEQRDEVARQGAQHISMAAAAIREYAGDYGDFQDSVEERVGRLHDQMPDVREPEIWDEIVSDDVQRGVKREMRELLGEDYSPRVGGDEFELEENEEDSDSDDSSFWSRFIRR